MPRSALVRNLMRSGYPAVLTDKVPYFGLPNPERLIGVLVDERLQAEWKLYIRGDRQNLPEILSEVDQVDLFHYDSVKSTGGRRRALSLVLPQLSPSALVIMDDVQDNHHFRELVAAQHWDYWVAPFAGKFTGLTGPGFAELSACVRE